MHPLLSRNVIAARPLVALPTRITQRYQFRAINLFTFLCVSLVYHPTRFLLRLGFDSYNAGHANKDLRDSGRPKIDATLPHKTAQVDFAIT
jgi:hypothetical protein